MEDINLLYFGGLQDAKPTKQDFRNFWGTILGVPMIRMIVLGGLYSGPPMLGKYQKGLGFTAYLSHKRNFNVMS